MKTISLKKEELPTVDLREIFCAPDTEFVEISSDKLILTIPRIFFKEDAIWRLSSEEMKAAQVPEDRIYFRDRSSKSDDLMSVFNTCEKIFRDKNKPFSISFDKVEDSFPQYVEFSQEKKEGVIVVPEPVAIVEYLRELESYQNKKAFHPSENEKNDLADQEENDVEEEDDGVPGVPVGSLLSISNRDQNPYSSMNTLSPREQYMKIDSFYREVYYLIEEEQKLPFPTQEINMKIKDAFQECKQLVSVMDPSKNTFLSEEDLPLSSVLDTLYPLMEKAYFGALNFDDSSF